MSTSINFNVANRADLKPSSKNYPCPICGRTHDGDCRISNDLVLYHHSSSHHPPNGVQPGEVPASCVDTALDVMVGIADLLEADHDWCTEQFRSLAGSHGPLRRGELLGGKLHKGLMPPLSQKLRISPGLQPGAC